MIPSKLARQQVKDYRELTLQQQNNKCALCGLDLELKDTVLDHNHKTGYIRGALHRFCNTYLGALENNIARNKITPEQLEGIMRNAIQYINSSHNILHPTYRTPEEKRAQAKKRAQQKRKAIKESKITSFKTNK